jgi:tetratricopeptide (TPR) repeat protein
VIVLVSVNYLAYKNALKQAWKDGKMSADESAMLDTLRKSLNISPDEHVKIEQDVRSELANSDNGNSHSQISENEQPPEPPEHPPEPSSNPGNPGVQAEEMPPESAEGMEAPVDQSNGASEIKTLLNDGKNSYHKGNYEEAIEYCDKVLLLDPDNSEALFFRKRTLSKIEKLRGKPNGDAAANNGVGANTELTPPAVGELNGANGAGGAVAPAGAGSGTGDPNCKSCKGSGTCHWCKGSGQCYWCKGTGKCDKCGGSGEINGEQCKSCKGAGKCHSCNGDSKCYWCEGSGKCNKCSM